MMKNDQKIRKGKKKVETKVKSRSRRRCRNQVEEIQGILSVAARLLRLQRSRLGLQCPTPGRPVRFMDPRLSLVGVRQRGDPQTGVSEGREPIHSFFNIFLDYSKKKRQDEERKKEDIQSGTDRNKLARAEHKIQLISESPGRAGEGGASATFASDSAFWGI